jgi:hypothetical protein
MAENGPHVPSLLTADDRGDNTTVVAGRTRASAMEDARPMYGPVAVTKALDARVDQARGE